MLKAISEAFSLLRATRQSPQRAASVLEQLDTRAKQRNETLKQILHEHQDAQRSRTEATRSPPLPTSSTESATEPVVAQPVAVPAQATTQSASKSGLRDTLDKIDMLLTEVNEMDKKILAMYEPAFKRSVDLAAKHNAQAKAATEEDQVLQKMQHIFENPQANPAPLLSLLQQTNDQAKPLTRGDVAALHYTIETLASQTPASPTNQKQIDAAAAEQIESGVAQLRKSP